MHFLTIPAVFFLAFNFFLPGIHFSTPVSQLLGKTGFVDPQIGATVHDMQLLPDGKFIVGGQFMTVAGQQMRRVARLHVDGSLDETFVDPQVTGIDPSNTNVFAIASQPDAKVIIGGSFDHVGGMSRYAIARLESDGTLDETFAASVNAPITSIALQKDGRILIGGYFTSVGGQPRSRMARLNADGTLDQSFQNAQFTSPAPSILMNSIALQPNGKILVGGTFTGVQGLSKPYLVRLEATGTVDLSFNTIVSGPISEIAIMPDGKILFCGFISTVNSSSRRGIARVFSDGSLDNSWQDTAIPSGNITAFDIHTDGKVVVGGDFAEIGGVVRNDIARLNSDGSTDTTFADPNAVFGGSFLNINSVIAQPDGKTLIGGNFATVGGRPRQNAVRLLTDGTLELSPPHIWMVTKTADSNDGVCDGDCSLREAISAANSTDDGSQIVFDPAVFSGEQTIVLVHGELVIHNSRPIFLAGPETGVLKISGNNLSRILRLRRDTIVEISNLSLENGNGVGPGSLRNGGAIFVEPNGSYTTLTLRSVKLRNNSAAVGGALGTQGISTVSINDSLIEGNSASSNQGGGGIHIDSGTLSISNSIVSGNSGGAAGGLSVGGFEGSAKISNTVITGNSSAVTGGVAFNGPSFAVVVTDSLISNNIGGTFAGGVYNQANTVISNSIISDNSSNSGIGNGGGVYNFRVLSIQNSEIRKNSSAFGAGIFTSGGLTVDNSVISANHAAVGGGGFYCNAGGPTGLPVVVTGSVISENISDEWAGGIYNRYIFELNDSTVKANLAGSSAGGVFNALLTVSPVRMNIVGSTLDRNVANGNGGAIVNQAAELTLTNSTLSQNKASNGVGGAIFLSSQGEVVINFSTIAFNTAALTGGIRISSGEVAANNSIVAKNRSRSAGPDYYGELFSTGFNLIGNTQDTVIKGDVETNILNSDPLLDPVLRANGGVTETHSLSSVSPAVDAGNSPAGFKVDQRGFSRPVDLPGVPNVPGSNAADIGALELQKEEASITVPFDFDGDGKTDVSVFRPLGGTGGGEWWYLRSSDGGASGFAFGSQTDTPVPADFTGDGKTDIAFWRESTGEWFVLRSEDSTFFAFPYGTAGDIPMPGDYDGDGEADATVFRPSTNTWYSRRSSDGGTTVIPFGQAGDRPISADFDGDGKADIAVFRPNGGSGAEWWYLRSSDGGNRAYAFGSSTDKAIPADFTGDGKADIAFWRPSTGEWYILRSEDDTFYAFPFGTPTDIPVPGDYDGDGKADAAVFRPSNNTWYMQRSTAGFEAIAFGSPGDIPLPNVYVR